MLFLVTMKTAFSFVVFTIFKRIISMFYIYNYCIFLISMQLNSIMERFAKEAVQKICSLFRYCSSVAPVPAQMCLNGRDDIKKTSSQMGRDLSGTTCILNQEFQGTWFQYLATLETCRCSTLYLFYLWSFLFVFLSHRRCYIFLYESSEWVGSNVSPATFKHWGE